LERLVEAIRSQVPEENGGERDRMKMFRGVCFQFFISFHEIKIR
jgi:hypothetical protein